MLAKVSAVVKQHPLPWFFLLAFSISWGAVLVLVPQSGFPATPEKAKLLLPVAIFGMLLGPSISGLVIIAIVEGLPGLRSLGARLLKWRAAPVWYGWALLAAPLLMLFILLLLARLSSDYLPGLFTTGDRASLLLLGVLAGLGAGILEELGWTGFAVPALRRRHSVLATGLIMGFLWGAWHYIVNFWGSGGATGGYDLDLLLPSLLWSLTILPAFRILMVWVYDRTGSLPLAMLMHLSLTAGMILFDPQAKAVLLTYDLVLAGSLIFMAAFVMLRFQTRAAQPAALSPDRAVHAGGRSS